MEDLILDRGVKRGPAGEVTLSCRSEGGGRNTDRWGIGRRHYKLVPCLCGSQQGVILLPRRHVAKSGDIFSCHDLGWGCYWFLAGRGKGYYSTS